MMTKCRATKNLLLAVAAFLSLLILGGCTSVKYSYDTGMGQIPPDLVVKSQAIDIIGLILSLIRGQDVIETSRRHVKIEV